ncbi:hypothetical protein ElyMa_007020600 [Elysia marginata]|uniref:Uncharacterized protein n=1 Tax=Elysia marginata TaxID=1093978 RepID=A0AAV4JUJ5_9GAST|nr:hypothetical protein ElyMa_007020600 [Elysia marginata]
MISTNQDSVVENNGLPASMFTKTVMCSLKEPASQREHQHPNRETQAQGNNLISNYQEETRHLDEDGTEHVDLLKVVDGIKHTPGCSGGLVAGGSIPAGANLGEWPEESILLGGDLLTQCCQDEPVGTCASNYLLNAVEVWACSILLSYGTVSSTMMNCCVEGEWITMSGFNVVLLMTSGCLSHSGRSIETSQSSQPSSSPFLWVLAVFDPQHHFLAPPSVVNIVNLGEGGLDCPFAVLITEASS